MNKPNEEKDPVVEKKDDNKSETSPQPEQTGEKTSPPANASGDKGLEGLLEDAKTAYGESSKEAKRLAAENKETKEAYGDAKKQIEELNEYIDILETKGDKKEEGEEKKEEKEDEGEGKEEKKEEKKPIRPSTKPTSAQEKIDYDKKWKENYDNEKNTEKEAGKKLAEAKEKYPGMAKKSYRQRVRDKMKADETLNILDACEKVDGDIELERAEIEGGEPFVESGSGAKGSQPPAKEDPIVDHLISGEGHQGGLEGI